MQNCNRSIASIEIHSPNDIKETMFFLQFIIIVLIPFVCTFGIITNILVVYTVSYKENEKDLKENQYKYMRLNAVFNILILIIEPITLISECQNYDLSIFCSQVRTWMFSQYFKIIFGEYISNVLRLAANFSYVIFSLNRLSLIGLEHGNIISKASKLDLKGFFLRIAAPCLILPVVKIFRFYPNNFLPDYDYPMHIEQFFHDINVSWIYVYLSFNLLYDFTNYVLFLIINFIIDISLVVKMKQILFEKENKNLGQQILKK